MDCFSRLIATEVGLVLNGSQPCEALRPVWRLCFPIGPCWAPAIQVADARLWTR